MNGLWQLWHHRRWLELFFDTTLSITHSFSFYTQWSRQEVVVRLIHTHHDRQVSVRTNTQLHEQSHTTGPVKSSRIQRDTQRLLMEQIIPCNAVRRASEKKVPPNIRSVSEWCNQISKPCDRRWQSAEHPGHDVVQFGREKVAENVLVHAARRDSEEQIFTHLEFQLIHRLYSMCSDRLLSRTIRFLHSTMNSCEQQQQCAQHKCMYVFILWHMLMNGNTHCVAGPSLRQGSTQD